MTNFAVVRTQGHQYKVTEGESFLVPKIVGELEFEVLLVAKGEDVTLGTPILEKHGVVLKVAEPKVLGEKIRVFKYKAKSRYRKTIGSRPQYSELLVEKIA